MRGISEERLREIVDDYPKDHRNHRMAKYLIATECKELNPWLPIDENTPKDKDLLLFCEYGKQLGYYDSLDGVFRAYGLGIVVPTHYQDLPDDPEPGDNNG